MDLRDVHQQLIRDIQSNLAVVAARPPMAEVGYAFEELIEHFEALGICHLLAFADAGEFQLNLVRAGHARQYFLRKSAEQETTGRYLALSRSGAFFAALAAHDRALAVDIAARSIVTWHPGWEYEDDFCYHRFLHVLTASPEDPPPEELEPLLAQWAEALQQSDATRWTLCRALLDEDAETFDETLYALMEAEQEQHRRRREGLELHDYPFWPRSFVSVEGLALLQVAGWRQMPTSDEYPLCPAPARLGPEASASPNLFERIERLT